MRENDLIKAIRSRVRDPRDVTGIGDDCCVWTPHGPSCLSTDTIVENRHFRAEDPPAAIGRKAAGAALSDLAAMGALPVGAVVAITCPARWDALAVMEGLMAELERHGCPLLGGDTTGGDLLVITVTVWGEAASAAHGPGRLLYRAGAAPGDLLVVTGPLGGSLESGRHLTPEPRFAEGVWFAQSPYVHALMDLSDGLAADAPKLAEASGCGCILLPERVPVHDDVPQMSDQQRAAMCDGEDFELLAAVAPEHWPHVQLAWPFPRPLCNVGWLIEQPGAWMEDQSGRLVPLPWQGFEHGGG
jgi:thiamine-monophosphate kinase